MARKYVFDDFLVYRDAKVSRLFYYLPGDLRVAADNEGKPDFRLLLMRYTGTRAYDDQGTHRFRNLMQMKIIHAAAPGEKLQAVKQQLKTLHNNPELRAFPVRNLKTVIVYSLVGTDDRGGTTVSGEGSYFSDQNDNASINEYWKERTFVIRLGNESANLFWDALQEQQTILSVGYAFYSEIYNSLGTDTRISGTTDAVRILNEMMNPENETNAADTVPETRVIKAGAFEVIIDTEKWPDLIKKVDINEQIPPDYAIINVYCFDFNNELRPDLAQKKIEIEAAGVGGGKVLLKYTFRSDMPDIYACDLKSPYAVRIDAHYRYRVTEITTAGAVTRSEWITRDSWHQILDITSKSDD